MSQKSRYLTKSRFKVGYECPTKLFYLDNPKYGNNNQDNSFLLALAEGGFQVGELAKLYHPGGTEITTTDKDKAAEETATLLQQESATIYEASFKHENLFIKADLVIKKGNNIQLIEVKAKSFDPSDESSFFTKSSLKKGKPKLSSEWEPYLIDVAFQTYVLRKSFPKYKISSYLMLADKTSTASVDGLNQLFFLKKDDKNRTFVEVSSKTSPEALGSPLLRKVNVDSEVEHIFEMTFEGGKTFQEMIQFLSEACEKSTFVPPVISSNCPVPANRRQYRPTYWTTPDLIAVN